MGKKRGIWIDHEKAMIVTLNEGEHLFRTILSDVGKHVHSGGTRTGSTPYGPQGVFAEDRQDRKYMQHLDVYYDEVIDLIKDSESIFVFGPGEAKGELSKRIRKSKELSKRLKSVETTDKMRERQVVAEVKNYFGEHG